MRAVLLLVTGLTGFTVASALAQSDSGRAGVALQADGATDWFGPGVTAVRRDGELLRLELARPAHLVGVHILPSGVISVLGTTSLAAGRHWLDLPAAGWATIVTARMTDRAPGPAQPEPTPCSPAELAPLSDSRIRGRTPSSGQPSCVTVEMRAAQEQRRTPGFAPRPERPAQYLLLIASDSAITREQVQARLESVRRFEFATVAHDLAEYLVGRRTPMWAGYLVRL